LQKVVNNYFGLFLFGLSMSLEDAPDHVEYLERYARAERREQVHDRLAALLYFGQAVFYIEACLGDILGDFLGFFYLFFCVADMSIKQLTESFIAFIPAPGFQRLVLSDALCVD
jgi:hypothetical protein